MPIALIARVKNAVTLKQFRQDLLAESVIKAAVEKLDPPRELEGPFINLAQQLFVTIFTASEIIETNQHAPMGFKGLLLRREREAGPQNAAQRGKARPENSVLDELTRRLIHLQPLMRQGDMDDDSEYCRQAAILTIHELMTLALVVANAVTFKDALLARIEEFAKAINENLKFVEITPLSPKMPFDENTMKCLAAPGEAITDVFQYPIKFKKPSKGSDPSLARKGLVLCGRMVDR